MLLSCCKNGESSLTQVKLFTPFDSGTKSLFELDYFPFFPFFIWDYATIFCFENQVYAILSTLPTTSDCSKFIQSCLSVIKLKKFSTTALKYLLKQFRNNWCTLLCFIIKYIVELQLSFYLINNLILSFIWGQGITFCG